MRLTFFRALRSRPTLLIAIAVGVAAFALTHFAALPRLSTRVLIGWNAGTLLYLALTLRMMATSSHEQMRQRACRLDEGQGTILLMMVAATVVCLAAIVAELADVKDSQGSIKLARVSLAALTIASSWLFVHTLFALHYAHGFYIARSRGESDTLQFPDEHDPDYFDFLYFSYIIGTSAQTADVDIAGRATRRLAIVHCLIAFFFNTTLLALTINIAAGLI